MTTGLEQDFIYLLLFSGLIIIPKLLKRWRLPEGMTCLFLGMLSSLFWFSFHNDQLLLLLSRLGITSLFLFAGLEVDIDELKEHRPALQKHLLINALLIVVVGLFLSFLFHLSWRVGLILALGLLTPSTGFILDSLSDFKLNNTQHYWIKSKSIAEEILAVGFLFLIMQSESWQSLLISLVFLGGLLIGLPLLFRFHIKYIAPYAPKSELAFLVLMALLSGVMTQKMGTYYLIGAFLVGLVAGRFNHFMNAPEAKNLFENLSYFFSLFIPFYFFKKGLTLTGSFLEKDGILIGIGFCLIINPIRYFSVQYSLKNFVDKKVRGMWKVSISLLPNLIFGLVIGGILKEKYEVSDSILSGLFLFTIVTSVLPAITFEHRPPKEYDLSTLD